MSHFVRLSVLRQWRSRAQSDAIAAGIAPTEVDWLLHYQAGVERLKLHSGEDSAVLELACPWSQLTALWQERCLTRRPLQQLVGIAPWRNWQIRVSADVLIPRPETEQLLDWVAERLPADSPLRCGHWVDLGTGSGILACGLAVLCSQATIHAVDVSAAALAIARQNSEQLGLSTQIKFYQGDWWQPLAHLHGQVSGMVANPPYIPTAELTQLQPEVRDHEPRIALDGGVDGLVAIRHLMAMAPDFLVPGGLWAIELMAGQAPQVIDLLHQNGHYTGIQSQRDWSGQDRFVLAYHQP